MARDIIGRFRLRGTLVARTPLHVGGHGDDVDTDLPLARDGSGKLYIPGTSFAGALRQWCEQAFGEPFVDRHWGFQEADKGHASYVVVEDVAGVGGEMEAEEVPRLGEGGAGLIKHRSERLEHVRDLGCDL